MWLESPLTFLHCCHEARMKKISFFPPNEKKLSLVQTKLPIHDVVAVAYYLENVDKAAVQLEGLVIHDCGLNDESLAVIERKIWNVMNVSLSGCYFSHRGINHLTKKLIDKDYRNIDTVELTNCQLDDECLTRLLPIFPYARTIILRENTFTWYGIRKIAASHQRSKNLRRLDMSRCQLAEHGFFELIPLVLRTEQVILQGNQFSPIELKLFGAKVRESKDMKLKTLDLSSSNLDDDSLYEISKFICFLEHVDIHNSSFGRESMEMLVKCCDKFHMGVLKSLNLRMCKLTDDCMDVIMEIVPYLRSIILTSNVFSGNNAIKNLAAVIEETEDRKLEYVELRHCRITDANKKILAATCKRHKINLKIY